MVLQSGSQIGIIANEDGELMIEVALSSSDRPRIHENDDVSIEVAGLNQAEYGTITGKVISIDEDATIDSQKVMFILQTRVKYEKITNMEYFLEQIGIQIN